MPEEAQLARVTTADNEHHATHTEWLAEGFEIVPEEPIIADVVSLAIYFRFDPDAGQMEYRLMEIHCNN